MPRNDPSIPDLTLPAERPMHRYRAADGAPLAGPVSALLRRRRLLLGLPTLAAGATVVVLLVTPRTFTVTAALLPQATPSAVGRVSGLAAELGVTLPVTDLGQSPQFFADLLGTSQLLGEVVAAPLHPAAGQETTLVAYYGVDDQSPDRGRALAIRRFRQDLSVTSNARTGTVNLEVRLHSGPLGVAVTQRLIDELNHLNLTSRRGQASSERAFVESRVEAAAADLRRAEQGLQAFLDRNREFANSARLRFEEQRLARAVDMQQAVYTSLLQRLEQARIDEVRNTPVIAVVAPPEAPALPDSRFMVFKALAIWLGLFMALAAGVLTHRTLAGDVGSEITSGELAALWREARDDLRRPWRILRMGKGPR